ncbi:histidine kinase [Sporosarcina sp. 179-K 8C2 HS]|uniref:sensor histidine kinase n=1 Tax=Sporosarcina sp. 179-K 8C2 HS TaxID=3142387 RepID=UPI00399F7225
MEKRMSLVNVFFLRMKKRPSNHMGLLLLYRYVSLGLTSFFFIAGMESPLYFTVSVIVSLLIAAWIITDIQKRYVENHTMLTLSVCAETIGLTLLLLPTGGISSPFIWYALNPVLVAASFLTPIFCWGILTFYLGSATLIAYQLGGAAEWSQLLEENSYFYLVCLLTTFLVRLFSGLTKELASNAKVLKTQHENLLQMNQRLAETNEKYQETVEHIMSHYHLMDSFSAGKSPKLIIEEITHSLKTCTRSEVAFFWLTDLSHQDSHIAATSSPELIEAELKRKWKTVRGKKESFIDRLNDTPYGMKIIRTSNNVGILGVQIGYSQEEEKAFLQNQPFEFLSELSEIMLERLHMDQMMDQMIVIEEQNRIANEIHDSVSQRLFGIVCSLHSLQVKGRHMTNAELIQEYQFLSQSANLTLKELRSAIFRLSSTKRRDSPFLVRLKKYLDEYARLNDIRINYQITGEEALIPDKVKQALYRIICEACGNAVRHGACHNIELSLILDSEKTSLLIRDDGIGYSVHSDEGKAEIGLGLFNIKSLVHSFAGTFSINGTREAGTLMEVEIPNVNMLILEKVVGE